MALQHINQAPYSTTLQYICITCYTSNIFAHHSNNSIPHIVFIVHIFKTFELVKVGNSPQPSPVCSTHLGDVRQPFCTRMLTTHQFEVELNWRKIMWPDGESQIGNFARTPGRPPTLCNEYHGILMTTVTQDPGLMSNLKDSVPYSVTWNQQHHFQQQLSSPT